MIRSKKNKTGGSKLRSLLSELQAAQVISHLHGFRYHLAMSRQRLSFLTQPDAFPSRPRFSGRSLPAAQILSGE